MIPVLKESVIFRENSEGAILINTEKGDYAIISPFEAFILSFFDGTKTTEYVTGLFKNFKNAPDEREILNVLYRFIQNRSEFIELINIPLKKGRFQISPYKFLLKTDIYKRPTRSKIPLSIDLYVTRRCNLNCIYCFADSKYIGNKIKGDSCNEMHIDRIKNLIDQIANLEIKKVTLTGGEPTLRPDLAEIIHHFIINNIEVFLATNAYSISDKQAQELRAAGLREVQVKLDAANSKTQDKLSGVRGSYEKLIKGIETLKKYSFKVSIVAVVTSLNIKEIPEVIKTCADLSVDEVDPRIYAPGIWALSGRGGVYLSPSSNSIKWLEKKIGMLQKRYQGVMKISSLDTSNFIKKKETEMPLCAGLISSCTILENGLVVPCELLADFSNEFIIGDANSETLIDIWNSEKAERWVSRKSPKVEEPCISCNEFGRCKGGCPWKSMVTYGKWLCDPFCIKAPNPTEIPFFTLD